jgi:CubicO group peptidase (beta-lactamase class C family)
MKNRERALNDVKAMFLAQHAQGRFGRGQLVVRQAGRVVLDESVGEDMTGDTPFQVMSASKAVVAVIVAMLEAQDGLDVDRPVAAFWPAFAACGKGEISPAPTLWRGGSRHHVGGQNIVPMFETINNSVSAVKALVPGAGMFTSARTLALFYDTLAAGGVTPSGERLVAEDVLGRYTRKVCMFPPSGK